MTKNSRDGFNPLFFKRLSEHEEGFWWFEYRNRLIQSAIQRYGKGAQSLMEIGCGTGFVLKGISQTLPHLHLTGTDFYEEGLSFARARLPKAHIFQLDARDMSHVPNYDIIGAFDVLEHIQEDEYVMAQIYSKLNSGGYFILTVPQHEWLWSAQDEHAHHVRRYTRKDILDKLQKVGFTVQYITSFVTLLLPLMFLSRLRNQETNNNADPFKEFDISPPLNILLRQVCYIEQFLLDTGLSMPWGGSLLMVSQRV